MFNICKRLKCCFSFLWTRAVHLAQIFLLSFKVFLLLTFKKKWDILKICDFFKNSAISKRLFGLVLQKLDVKRIIILTILWIYVFSSTEFRGFPQLKTVSNCQKSYAMILFMPDDIISYSLIAQFLKCFNISLSGHLILLKRTNTKSVKVLLVSWKCLAMAIFRLLFSMSCLCSSSVSLGWQVLLPRNCFWGALELHRR